jgi:hypothetical protein
MTKDGRQSKPSLIEVLNNLDTIDEDFAEIEDPVPEPVDFEFDDDEAQGAE